MHGLHERARAAELARLLGERVVAVLDAPTFLLEHLLDILRAVQVAQRRLWEHLDEAVLPQRHEGHDEQRERDAVDARPGHGVHRP